MYQFFKKMLSVKAGVTKTRKFRWQNNDGEDQVSVSDNVKYHMSLVFKRKAQAQMNRKVIRLLKRTF